MKIRSKVTIGLLSSVMCVAAVAHAAGKYTKAEGAEGIKFVSTATAVTINGKVPEVTVAQEEGEHLVFKVDLHKLKTGIGLRDTHTKDLLRVKKYPMAELRIPKTVNPKGKSVKGRFTMNDATNEVTVSYTAAKKNGAYHVTANFTLDVTQFNVDPEKLCYLGVCANKETKVTATVAMTPPGG